jgi:hypothetical protein
MSNDSPINTASEIEHAADLVRRKSGDIYVQKLAKVVMELARLCEEQEQKISKLESAGNSG